MDLKRSQGVYSWGQAPYGYIRTVDSPNRLQFDLEVSAYVRLIFLWGLEGIPIKQIAARLTNLKAPTYQHLVRSRRKGCTRKDEPNLWSPSTVKQILLNQTYAGDFVYQKSYFRKYDAAHGHRIPEDEWLIIPDAHPAYIDRNDFLMLKERIITAKRVRSQQLMNQQPIREQYPALFKGIIYCGLCGRHMSYRRSTTGTVYTAYYCKGEGNKYRKAHQPRLSKRISVCP